jgi:hypothetical protein
MGAKMSGGLKTLLTSEPLELPTPPCYQADPTQFQRYAPRDRLDLYDPDLQKPAHLDALLGQPAANTEAQLKNGWNPDDRSLNIFIKEDDILTVGSGRCLDGK